MTPASRRLCDTLGITVPVLGAPMAGIAGGALAAAVSRAGGLGCIGGGYGDLDWIRAEMARAGVTPVAMGLITWRLVDRPGVLEAVLELPIRALVLSFGDPAPALRRAQVVGVPTVCQVQSVDEARHAVDLGTQVVVAQGNEAGGHGRSNDDVRRLLSEVVAAVDPVPVVAAGGIVTAGDARSMRSEGAAGVMAGTRLYATDEALDHPAAKAALVGPGPRRTRRTTVVDMVRGPRWPPGYDGRALSNDLVERWHDRLDELEAALPEVQADYRRAAETADTSTRVVWAGSAVERVDRVQPAAAVVAHLASAFT